MPLTFAQAELLGLVLHSCLIGLYIVLFFQTLPFDMDEDYRVKRRTSYNRIMLGVNVSLFITIIAHWVVQIIRANSAFIDTVGQPDDAATIYYAFPAYTLNLLKEALYLTQTFIGDCTMIYRLWVVYNRRFYIVVVPIAIVIAYGVSAIAVVVELARLVPGQDIFVSTAGRWAITVFTTSVSTNVMTTALITFRIFYVRRELKDAAFKGSKIISITHIIIESAALYTTFAVLTLIGYSTKQLWQFITIDMLSPIIGISFTLISVRVARTSSFQLPSTTGDITANTVRFGRQPRSEHIGLDSISVTVTKQVDQHMDEEHEGVSYSKGVVI